MIATAFFFFFFFFSSFASLPLFAFKHARGYFEYACVYVLIDTRNPDPRNVTMRIDQRYGFHLGKLFLHRFAKYSRGIPLKLRILIYSCDTYNTSIIFNLLFNLSSIFQCNPGKTSEISLLLLNNLYPVISYRQFRKKKKAANYL